MRTRRHVLFAAVAALATFVVGLPVAVAQTPAGSPVAPSATAKPSAKPKSTPSPPDCIAVQSIPATPTAPATVPAATFCLNYRSAPSIDFPSDLAGAGPHQGGALNPRLAPSATPAAIAGLHVLALEANPEKNKGATGLMFALKMTAAPVAAPRLVNGVPLNDNEHRFAIVIQRATRTGENPDLHRLVVEVNDAGACVETSRILSDDLFAACKVALFATPKNSPSPAPATPPPSPSPDVWTAYVTIPYAALNELFARPVPTSLPAASVATNDKLAGVRGPVTFTICSAVGAEPLRNDREEYYRRLGAGDTSYQPPGAGADVRECSVPIVLVYRQGTKGSYNFRAGDEKGSGSTSASSGSTTAAGRTRLLAKASSSAATPAPASASSLTGTFAQPLTAYWQASGQVQSQSPFLAALSKQTNSTLSSVVQQQVSQQSGRIVPGGLGTTTTSTAFSAVDADVLNRLMPSAFRGFSDASTKLTNQPQAFDSTDVLDLAPFNPTLINSVTVGGKIASVNPLFNSLGQRLGLAGLGWFHDSTRGASGTIVHIDQDVNPFLSIGLSQIVGNTVTAPSNKYVAYLNPANPAYPVTSPSPNPVLHSANTVVGGLVKFGGGGNDESKPFQLFARLGTNGLGRDWLGAISGADLGKGRPLGEGNGTSLSLAALAGYRAIGYGYTPLLTSYNPFAGNQIYFGRLNIGITAPQNQATPRTIDDRSGTLSYTLSVSGVYADDGGRRGYGSFGVSPSIPLNAKPDKNTAATYSLTGAFQRSYISSTVLARQSGSVVIPPGPLNLLSNDSTSLNLQLQSTDQFLKARKATFTVTSGLSLVHSPSCAAASTAGGAPSCGSPFAKKLTWTVNAGSSNFILYADSVPGTTRTNPTSISPSIPANTIQTTVLLAYHICNQHRTSDNAWGIEPSLTFKNNVAQDGSAFQPGTLLDVAADIGPAKGIKALASSVISISYQNAVNSGGTPVALKNNGFRVALTSASQAIWQAHKSKADPCLAPKTG